MPMPRAFHHPAALALLVIAGCASLAPGSGQPDFGAFLDRMDHAQREVQQGRPDAYKALWSQRADVTLGGGFGGGFERGWDGVSKRLDWASSQFRQGSNEIQRVSWSTSGDLGYVVQTERIRFTASGSNAAAERNYRVTMVFRREDAQWRIVHRHADTQTSREAPR